MTDEEILDPPEPEPEPPGLTPEQRAERDAEAVMATIWTLPANEDTAAVQISWLNRLVEIIVDSANARLAELAAE